MPAPARATVSATFNRLALCLSSAHDTPHASKSLHPGRALLHFKEERAPFVLKKLDTKCTAYAIRALRLMILAYTNDVSPRCKPYSWMAAPM